MKKRKNMILRIAACDDNKKEDVVIINLIETL